MATIGWRADRTVKQVVLEHYERFDVFQLLRLMHWPVPAQQLDPQLRLRFRADLSAGFAGHEFSALRYKVLPAQGSRPASELIEIKTANYCIASQLGPLPEPYVEWIRDLKRARTPALADFLDVFNHRLNCVRYQLKARQTLALNHLPPAQTEHAAQLAAIMGLGLPQLSAQIDLPKRSLLGLAGLLANCRKSADAIAQVLTLYIGAKVSVMQWVGAWQMIEADERIALGQRNQRLGQHSLLGKKAWDQAARIRIVVAPLNYARFSQLLPPALRSGQPRQSEDNADNNRSYNGLIGLLRLLVNGLHDCEMQLHLLESEVPAARLVSSSKENEHGQRYLGLRLSHSAWLSGSEETTRKARQINYLIPAFASMEQV
ncbi:type VI secretion system baseplate subunit TssG [Undibacterium crateris]|uniref:type VI secretion system baseplate subunit TssG n=1 Tax=Undibacterium crateris TaxID=2528175 RepID=UPI001389D1FD|nr:type VI secretion system baseplate subunit TssG [Undibacterium crateris]NDI84161.1 type VI secretion system baseplate subunit TssG [Undibacterium crateris]